LLEPGDVARLDLTIDGADEIDPDLTATKGGGCAHLREKVVATMSERFVIIATSDKQVERLGDTFPIPIEVVPFALEPVRRTVTEEGFQVVARRRRDGGLVITDNGNHLLDARLAGGIEDPAVVDVWLATVPGVVTSGLFVDLAERAVLGNVDGSVVTVMRPAE
ncbi:MAG: ribose 5-phosphate isomerase A, partial [Nitriliruptoraceae bacterium]